MAFEVMEKLKKVLDKSFILITVAYNCLICKVMIKAMYDSSLDGPTHTYTHLLYFRVSTVVKSILVVFLSVIALHEFQVHACQFVKWLQYLDCHTLAFG